MEEDTSPFEVFDWERKVLLAYGRLEESMRPDVVI